MPIAVIEVTIPGPSIATTSSASRIAGKRQQHVHDPHQNAVPDAAPPRREETDQRAGDRRDGDRGERDAKDLPIPSISRLKVSRPSRSVPNQ